jgi:hypothetical protein
MSFFVCLGIFHRQKSNFGKIYTLCFYSINIDVIVCFIILHTHTFLLIYITVLWSNTTQIVINYICVIFSRRRMSLSICTMVQLYITRQWKYSTNVNCHCQSKTEESKGCNYYFPDLKSDCNNGGKLL